MEVIHNIENDPRLSNILSKRSANQDVHEQVLHLESAKDAILAKLVCFKDENPRRPSKKHKELRADLKQINKEIKETKKAVRKCKALQDAANKIGLNHGKVVLNSTRYHW